MNDIIKRCDWVGVGKPYYEKYHDEEWGVPVFDDRKHFEMLILEGAQAGLSWETILKKRAGYQKAFKNFDYERVAAMTDDELEQLLLSPDIVRNRLKIFATRSNAQVFIKIQKEFVSFNNYIWGFVGGMQKVNQRKQLADLPATSPESEALSKDLKKRGMKFVGATIMYSHMQAAGLVNDHFIDCWRYRPCIVI